MLKRTKQSFASRRRRRSARTRCVEAIVEAVMLIPSNVEAIEAILSTSARKKVTLNFQFWFLGFTVCQILYEPLFD